MVMTPGGSDPRMIALARPNNNCKRQTRPLVREGAVNKNLVLGPRRVLDTKTDWQTDRQS
jgi:hypothetical protein